VSFAQFLQYVFSGITSGSVYALTALGFTLVYNATDIINFAQGQLVMLGGMMAVGLHSLGLPLAVCFIGAVATVVIVSIAFEQSAIRPLMGKGVIAQIIATVGVSFVLEAAAMLIWGRDAKTLPPFTGDTPIKVAGATIVPQTLWVVGVTVVTVLIVYFVPKFGDLFAQLRERNELPPVTDWLLWLSDTLRTRSRPCSSA